MTESTSRRPAYARLLDRAVRILAVRDHSEQELRRKLAAPIYSAAIFLIPICISFDTAEKRRYATYLILNRRFSFEF